MGKRAVFPSAWSDFLYTQAGVLYDLKWGVLCPVKVHMSAAPWSLTETAGDRPGLQIQDFNLHQFSTSCAHELHVVVCVGEKYL